MATIPEGPAVFVPTRAEGHPALARRPVMLDCCVCGGGSHGRQWWNRDDGYGICDRCAPEQAEIEGPKRMESLYGVQGVHYLLDAPPAAG